MFALLRHPAQLALVRDDPALADSAVEELLRIGLPALLRRFPELRLAVPSTQVPMRSDMPVYGVYRLPVEW